MLSADPVIDRHFRWLSEMGYEVVARDADYGGPNTTYGKEQVVVHVSYHWHDTYAQVSVRHRQKLDIQDEPLWARVSLQELLTRRAPSDVPWISYPPNDTELDGVFESGAALLRKYASDLLEGENPEELDQIVAERPHMGVPGLDFPSEGPWFPSQEGVWFTTDFRAPEGVATLIGQSQSPDPTQRAKAALNLIAALRNKPKRAEVPAAHLRLHELLADENSDVRRAAANSLGQWPDRDALDPLMDLLADEPRERPSPVAAAIAFIAIDADRNAKQRALAALRDFRAKGEGAATQCDELEWRIGGTKRRGYPRLLRLWRGPGRGY